VRAAAASPERLCMRLGSCGARSVATSRRRSVPPGAHRRGAIAPRAAGA
jgi:hypothetical protein